MFLGIDIGSTSSKAVVLGKNKNVLSSAVINIGTGTKGPERVVERVISEAKIEIRDVVATVVTGYGRITYQKADKQITEISCHAKGVHYVNPKARTIIDIGGQDAKVIRLDDNGKVENFVMNEKCAAGTGRFLEVMARILDCPIDKLDKMSQQATEDITISSICTVFAESEVISQLAAGTKRENVAQGAHIAVAKRVAGLANRIGIEPEVVMTGGVALNRGVVTALERELKEEIIIMNPQIMGALGAALYAYEMAVD